MQTNEVRKYFCMPTVILENSDNWQCVAPILAHMLNNMSFKMRFRTDLYDLFEACGYKYNNHAKASGQYWAVIDALNFLLENDYIREPIDRRTGEMLDRFDGITSKTKLDVFINEELCHDAKNGFLQINTTLYDRLYWQLRPAENIAYWRIFLVFSYLARNMRPHDNSLMYYSVTQQQMAKHLEHFVGIPTLSHILTALDGYDIIHRADAGRIGRSDGTVASVGYVYVMHQPGWEKTLRQATENCCAARRQYYGQ